jgi:addiction module HigA family antidote
MQNWKEPIHPGEILSDELEFIGVNASLLAANIEVPKNRIYQVISGKRGITADTALRLAVFFGTTPDFWLNLQKSYELDLARQEVGDSLFNIKPYSGECHPN